MSRVAENPGRRLGFCDSRSQRHPGISGILDLTDPADVGPLGSAATCDLPPRNSKYYFTST
jgi:hypothetical protein